MIKYTYLGSDDKFYHAELLQSDGRSNGFCKTAAAIPDVLKEEIEKIKPQKDKVFLIIAPLGMGEFWGPNVNGDFFPEKALRNSTDDYGHKTFLKANLFRHHINKDPEIAFGKPIVSVIDEPRKRVVTITELDIPRAKKFGALEFLEMLSNGQLPDVSMGCKVPFDTCSICGKKSKTPMEYCEHLQPGKILSYDSASGKIACAINDFPKFFDLSFVHKGADRSSGTLYKISGDLDLNRSSYFNGFDCGLQKAASDDSDLSFAKVAMERPKKDFFKNNDLCQREKMDYRLMDKIAHEDLGKTFGTFYAAGFPLRADEIQYIVLKNKGFSKVAMECYKNNVLLDGNINDFSGENINLSFSEKVFDVVKFAQETSLVKKQKPFIKKASNAIATAAFLGALWGLSKATGERKLMESVENDPEYWKRIAPQLIRGAQKRMLDRESPYKNYPTQLPPGSGLSSVPPRYGHPYNLVDGIMPEMHRVRSGNEKQASDDKVAALDIIRKGILLSLHSFFKNH